MLKKILKRILPERLIWWLNAKFPSKPFLDDVVKSERGIEYGWVFRNLPKSGRVLDVGSSGSWFAHILASMGYIVYALDWKKRKSTHQNMICIQSDIMKFCGETFDAITCISALEHIALRENWNDVVNKLLSLLKPDGVLLITVPCGVPVTLNGYKVFHVNAFPKAEYFMKSEDGEWIKTEAENVANILMKNKDEVKSIMCVGIRRKNV